MVDMKTMYGTCSLRELLDAVDALNEAIETTESEVGVETRVILTFGVSNASISVIGWTLWDSDEEDREWFFKGPDGQRLHDDGTEWSEDDDDSEECLEPLMIHLALKLTEFEKMIGHVAVAARGLAKCTEEDGG